MSANLFPRVSWPEYIEYFTDKYQQGQHVSIIAMNGYGKTHLVFAHMQPLLRMGMLECFLWTKPRDEEIAEFFRRNGPRAKIIDGPGYKFPDEPPLVGVRPKSSDLAELKSKQSETFRWALNYLWEKGYWMIVLDELRYLTMRLKLTDEVTTLLLQARSSMVSLWLLSQRPRWVPLETWSEARYHIIGTVGNRVDRKTIVENLGVNEVESSRIFRQLSELRDNVFLWHDKLTHESLLIKAPRRIEV